MDASISLITVGFNILKGWQARRLSLTIPLGHAGALRQARQLGKELYIGLHSDEDILENKGPTVMTLDERCVFRSSTNARDGID